MTPGEKQRFRAQICEIALPLFLLRPPSDTTIRSVADSLGVSYWSVYRQYETREALYRDAIERLFGEISAVFERASRNAATVHEAIRLVLGTSVFAMRRGCYRDMLFFVLRDSAAYPWVHSLYQRRILNRFVSHLEGSIRAAGERHGAIIGIQPGAAVRALRVLETALVMPQLLPDSALPHEREVEAILDTATNAVMAATFSVDFTGSAAA